MTQKRRVVEALAVRYFKRRAGKAVRPDSRDAIHFLNPDERRELRRIEYVAVGRAGLVGAICAGLGAVANVALQPLLGDDPGNASWWAWIEFLVLTLLAVLPLVVIELSLIYWNAIDSVHQLAAAAGLPLFRAKEVGQDVVRHVGDMVDDEDEIFAAVLARAALEIPNPPRPMFGIDPRREASRLRILMATLVYKAKVSLTKFIARTLLTRIFGRAALRAWIPFVAVPITALWDALVCRRALREARLRAIGPSAANELLGFVLAPHPEPSPGLREALMRAIGSAVVRSRDFHPNLIEMLDDLKDRIGETDAEALDDVPRFIECLRRLLPAEQKAALHTLVIACILDGRVRQGERAIMARAFRVCGRPPPRIQVLVLQRALLSGDQLAPKMLELLTP
ncbi:LBF_2804 family protein [Nannocystis bainbridge]|uniref:Tellurite resistance protein TerB n=1 Tax=Nannocystis bainbridge TaxID=2995303 RepID=A0ABT5DTC9_9BACT|nr:hypothetical protein [Nannocystis bainbridge]MDC0716319.1 hypothetical protein [Nannocystis bainbridge]